MDDLAQAIEAAVLALVLWIACAGAGTWILPRPPTEHRDDAVPDWNRPGVAACVGLGVLLALGGVGTALNIPIFITAVTFVVAGVALAGVALLGLPRRAVPWLVLGLTAVTIAGFGLMALLQSHVALRAQINSCDELRAYLPMVHRLLDTNAIVEPWSYRRLQNLGGFTYLEAIPVKVLGDVGIGVAEVLLAGVFLGGLFIGTGFRSTWTRIASLLFILAIPVLWIPRINVAPVLFTVPLLVASFAVSIELRVALRDRNRRAALRWAVAAGLLVAGIASVRAPTMPLAAGAIGLGVLTISSSAWMERVRALAIAAAAAVVAIGPWLLASWVSVDTPLYPLLPGNANTSVPSERNPDITTLADYAHHTIDYFRSGSFFWIALGVLIIAVLARRFLPDARFVMIVAAVSIVCMLGFSVTLSIASDRDFGRYIAPMGESLAVFLFYEVLRTFDPCLAGADGVAGRPRAWAGALALAASLLALLAAFTPIAVRTDSARSPLLPSGFGALRWDELPVPGFQRANRLTPPGLQQQWKRALRHIDPKHTIVAADRPYLIDYSRYDLPNMDLPGWASPTGTFPYFRGPVAKLAFLRSQGFNQLIVTQPVYERCLLPSYLRIAATYGPPDSVYTRYYLDWSDDVTAITNEVPGAVKQFGILQVIDLRKAEAALRHAGR